MHIEVNLSLQKVNSNVKRKFIPEEIDWVLNKMIGRFVKSKLRPDEQTKDDGFQSDQIDLDALRTLMVLDKPLPVYKIGPNVLAEFPGNYSFLVRDRSGLVRDCDANYDTAADFGVSLEYVSVLKIRPSTKGSAPYYTNPVLTVNGQVVMNVNNLPNSLPDKGMVFAIHDAIKNILLNTELLGITLYWERYKNIYSTDSLIVVSNTMINTTSISFDANTYTAVSNNASQSRPIDINSTHYRDNRLIKTNHVGKLQDSSFSKSQWRSPISAVQGNSLKVYCDNKFIVNNISIDYIRKPRLVSLSLSQNCDLPDDFHLDICDQTVEYLTMTIGDPRYTWKLQDNLLRDK